MSNKFFNTITILISLVITLFASILIFTKLSPVSHVIGDSMNPTFYDGQIIFKTFSNAIGRGDVIGATVELDGELKNVIKRVVGLPGETVDIKEDGVYINNELIEEGYLNNDAQFILDSTKFIHVELKENEYFILGDNRAHSGDSRYFGAITGGQIDGVWTGSFNEYSLFCLALIVVLVIIEDFILNILLAFSHKTKNRSSCSVQSSKF